MGVERAGVGRGACLRRERMPVALSEATSNRCVRRESNAFFSCLLFLPQSGVLVIANYFTST